MTHLRDIGIEDFKSCDLPMLPVGVFDQRANPIQEPGSFVITRVKVASDDIRNS